MRIVVSLLLLHLVAAGDLEDFFVKRAQNAAKDIDKRRENFQKSFGRADVKEAHAKLGQLRVTWTNKLKQNNEKATAEINQRLKNYRPKPRQKVKEEGDTLAQVNEKANVTDLMYQGDIVLTAEQAQKIVEEAQTQRMKRQAYRDIFYPQTIWGSTVYYYFDNTATSAIKSVFNKAVEFWQKNTCINFQESTTASNRIKVFKGQGCYSYIGMIRGVQELSLGSGCESVGTAAHELGHALGFFHTQSRYDRDNAITVNLQNIVPGYVDQFDKESSQTNFNYGMPYDYGSVMQYGGLSASSNGRPTMVAKNINYQDTMGSDMVSFYDISMMNEHYSCKAKCPAATSAKCQNGGFPNSRSCGTCICPSGYGGDLCNTRPSGCGQTLTPTASWQSLSDSIGDGVRKTKEDFTKCNYWIQGTPGQRIEVKMTSFSGTFVDGCVYGGIEMKTNADQKLTGYRFCSGEDLNKSLTSSSHIVPIVTFNRYNKNTVTVQYRVVAGSTGSETVATTTVRSAPSTCQDTSNNCRILQFFGYCNMRHVKKQCARSCNKC